MRHTCEEDYDKSVFRETKNGAMTNYNDDVSNKLKPNYNKYKNLVCTGPYWNNSRHTKKLKLKFISKKLRDYLEKADELYKQIKIRKERYSTSEQMDEDPTSKYHEDATLQTLINTHKDFVSENDFAKFGKFIYDPIIEREENQLKLQHKENSSGGKNRSRRKKTRRR